MPKQMGYLLLLLVGSMGISPAAPLTIYEGRLSPSNRIENPSSDNMDGTRRYNSSNYGSRGREYRHRWSGQFIYQAPVHTTVQQNIQVIAPAGSTVIYSQDRYQLYPVDVYPVYRHQQRVIEVAPNINGSESRAKQWTDKSDMIP